MSGGTLARLCILVVGTVGIESLPGSSQLSATGVEFSGLNPRARVNDLFQKFSNTAFVKLEIQEAWMFCQVTLVQRSSIITVKPIFAGVC